MTERDSVQMKLYTGKPAMYEELILLPILLLTVTFSFQLLVLQFL